MRIARFALGDDVGYGLVDDAATEIAVLRSHPFAELEPTGLTVPLEEARLLAPVLPSKVLAFARTYAEHARELGNAPAADPLMFLKPSTSVIGPGDVIRLPALSGEVHHEAELAVVIGALCKDVPAEDAHQVVLGYTCANDVTARDLQRRDGQWSRAKGFDTFCPLGPWIETELDPSALAVTCRIDDRLVQDGTTADLLHSVAAQIAYASSAMTLLPGDVILTGTPAGVGPLRDGDEVTVAVEGIGELTNPVRALPGHVPAEEHP